MLLTNDMGRYAVLDLDAFASFAREGSTRNAELDEKLAQDGFCYGGSTEGYLLRHVHQLRDAKNYLFHSTCLFIFVVTTECNTRCRYCQADGGGHRSCCMMDEDVARKAVDIAVQSPERDITFEFQGGEPLIAFPIIRTIVEYAEEVKGDKQIRYSLVSNLSLLREEHISFFVDHSFGISTSLDGPKALHDANRPMAARRSSFDLAVDGIRRIQDSGLSIGAIETTTRRSLGFARDIVQQYCDLGLKNICLRPLTPLGSAGVRWNEIGYEPVEFAAFYKEALDAIMEKNTEGIAIQEGFASTVLEGALHGHPVNHMECRSPCGATFGQMAFSPAGGVFTCDEARMLHDMGDPAFRLGSVDDTYRNLVSSPVCRATCVSSILESMPACFECVYRPYCGSCPVVNYALGGDLQPKSSNGYRCAVNKGMLDAVFGLLVNGNDKVLEVLRSWRA